MNKDGGRIIDAVMFYNELDMIKLRFDILDPVVDVFIVLEAGETHSGNRKGKIFWDALVRGEFDRWKHKIVHYYIDRLNRADSWARERFNRSLLHDPIRRCGQNGDIVIVADCDEIPNPKALATLSNDAVYRLEMDFYYYDFNWRVREGWSIGAVPYIKIGDPNDIRTLHGESDVITVDNAGWHLSYFLTPEGVIDKVDAFMHHADVAKDMPRDAAWIAERMKKGQDLFGRTTQIEAVPIENTLPEFVLANAPYYQALGWLR